MSRCHVLWPLLVLACAAGTEPGSEAPPQDADGPAVSPPLVPPEGTVVLDFGELAHHEKLLEGWSEPEGTDLAESWVWARAKRASLELELPHAGFNTLAFRCWPYVPDGVRQQTIAVTLNGEPLGVLELESGRQLYTLELARTVPRAGRNVVTFDFGHALAPRDHESGSSDTRTLAAAFDFLRFEPREPAAWPSGDPSLFFAGTGVETVSSPLKSPPGDTVRIELEHETRSALRATPGEVLERRLEVRPGTRLEVAAAAVCPPGARCLGAGRVRVDVKRGWRRETLWEHSLEPGIWNVKVLDLTAYAGRRIDLELHFEASAVGPGAFHTFWAEPLLLAPARRPNLLVISIDTLRADHLGVYGYGRDTSPHLDELARDGVLFRRATSQSPWTTPSHMSLMTSLYPSSHRVNQGWGEVERFMLGRGTYRVLSPRIDTLAGLLRREGYRTFAVTGGTTLSGEFGFAQGFDVYQEHWSRGFRHLTPEVETTLRQRLTTLGETPFFLFFHTFEAHAPYKDLRFVEPLVSASKFAGLEELLATAPAEPIPAQREHLKAAGLYRPEITAALYDGGIRRSDEFLGRLFAMLRGLGLWDDTLVVVTSDHGEEFADHSPERFYDAHCNTVYEELLWVPLVLRVPDRFAGAVVEPPVELVDVAPTVLELLGLEAPTAMQGKSLVPLIGGDESAGKGSTLSEATCTEPEIKALRLGDYKLITAFETGGEKTGIRGKVIWERLFDLARDPAEAASLHASDRELLELMRRALGERFAALPKADGTDTTLSVSAETMEQLRALGYVN